MLSPVSPPHVLASCISQRLFPSVCGLAKAYHGATRNSFMEWVLLCTGSLPVVGGRRCTAGDVFTHLRGEPPVPQGFPRCCRAACIFIMLSTVARRLGRARGRLSALGALRTLSASAEPAPEPVPLSKLKDQFLNATSSTYLEELEERYRSNPKSVDKSWASFFHSMG